MAIERSVYEVSGTEHRCSRVTQIERRRPVVVGRPAGALTRRWRSPSQPPRATRGGRAPAGAARRWTGEGRSEGV